MRRTKASAKRNPAPKRRATPKVKRPAAVRGFCGVCGHTDIPLGDAMLRHMERHTLTLEIDDLYRTQYEDVEDRFVPGVKEYRKVVRKALGAASEINELARMFSLKDKRPNKPRKNR